MTSATHETALLLPACRVSHFDGWTLHTADRIPSTNPVAGKRLPAWHALRALVQTAAYGRTGRVWTSDPGGLWLSANLPCPGERARWAILPLAAGWAVTGALRELGLRTAGLRLRWPNDIMIGPRKLAGLLVERFTPDTATIGIGLNLTNSPERIDAALTGATARLCDHLPDAACDPDVVLRRILAAIRRAHAMIADPEQGFAPIAADLNAAWSDAPSHVAITLTAALGGATREGRFHGIDADGRLRLAFDDDPVCHFYDATQIELLRERGSLH
ncbi:birA, biotin-(acetyl-CoA-carboxylase) ligase [Opitutaceae bacterium TAV1]|nr:birA, biotin-(acetyl-CoA-carboxylase) ligase [Opitutaceae bacterium TAV1]